MAPAVNQHVFRLDITVDEPPFDVRVMQRARGLGGDLDHFQCGQSFALTQHVPCGHALEVLHHKIDVLVLAARFVDADDVGVLESVRLPTPRA